jgi:D-3-phosphoglycerate dehydrogenase
MGADILMTSSKLSDGKYERKLLEPLGARLIIADCKNEEDVIDAGKEAFGLIVTVTPIGEKVFNALPNLKIVARTGIGVDNIDLETARKHGVTICNVPDYCLNEVADHAMALLLATERKIVQQHMKVISGKWEGVKGVKPIYGLQERVLGLIGFGGIGRLMVPRAKAFGLKVIAYDPYVDQSVMDDLGVLSVTLNELLKNSDYVSLHAPLTDETRHVIDSNALKMMKPTAFLINTARGSLIDRVALKTALADGRIAGAAMDVIEDNLEGAQSFSQMPNVIFTSYMAYYTEKSLDLLRKTPAEEIARFLKGKPVKNRVV